MKEAEHEWRALVPTDLAAMAPAAAACRQVLQGRRAPQVVRVGLAVLQAEWQPHGGAPAEGLEAALRIGRWRYVLRVDRACSFAWPGLDFAALPPVSARTLAAELAQDALRAIEQAAGLPMVIDGLWMAAAPTGVQQGLGLLLRDATSGVCTRAMVVPQDDAAFEGLAQLCGQWPHGARAKELPAWRPRCRLCLGATRLPVVELAQLAAGDLLFIDSLAPGWEPIRAALFVGDGRNSLCLVALKDQEIRIMDDEADHQLRLDDGEAFDAPQVRLLDRLEFDVRFWLGGRRLAWHEIQSLQPGSVLTLGQDVAEAEVQLEVEDQRIGRGRLVAVGKRLGVCITSIARPDEQASADEPAALS